MTQIIDNFLPEEEFNSIQSLIMGIEFGWFYTDGASYIDYPDGKTAVFYINTNDGYTEFESGVRVSSVANRVCIFDSNLEHRGTTHSEGGHQRVVVNFNYE